jgi:hypothetical protein
MLVAPRNTPHTASRQTLERPNLYPNTSDSILFWKVTAHFLQCAPFLFLSSCLVLILLFLLVVSYGCALLRHLFFDISLHVNTSDYDAIPNNKFYVSYNGECFSTIWRVSVGARIN